MKKQKNRSRRPRAKLVAGTQQAPSIVRLAAAINDTESAIGAECTNNVRIQMKLNESTEKCSTLRKVLQGLHREMDKHTASTRLQP